ncbi:hypothetical protein CTI12_AA058760 [Artemisia annua]|uniref:Uncharacterized protein n=1 Tax=Artemisia annua TaxID=35608 RepID=A0A2U1Q3B0_ARTAN|nr:hypothetical protein CTI12_AA058760 [Artemisia annua]
MLKMPPRPDPQRQNARLQQTVLAMLRANWYLLAFALHGVVSMFYGPLMGMIQMKFQKASPFGTTIKGLLYTCLGCYISMTLGFGAMIYIIIQVRDAGGQVYRWFRQPPPQRRRTIALAELLNQRLGQAGPM